MSTPIVRAFGVRAAMHYYLAGGANWHRRMRSRRTDPRIAHRAESEIRKDVRRSRCRMPTITPIKTAHLFRDLHVHLVTLLRGLAADDWNRPTVCSRWTVKDIASHLLDGCVRRLSAQRDRYVPPGDSPRFASYEELLAYLDRLNADWTAATRRVSPRVIVELLEVTGIALAEMFETADPFAPALFPVAWAGETHSLMWFDIAREYTERWHHQRQIVDAVGAATAIDEPRLYHPVLDTFLRALPHAFCDVVAEEGTVVVVGITGPAGGDWRLRREDGAWQLLQAAGGPVAARVVMPQDVAWRVFTKRRNRAAVLRAFPSIRLEGDENLGGRVLEVVSIMA